MNLRNFGVFEIPIPKPSPPTSQSTHPTHQRPIQFQFERAIAGQHYFGYSVKGTRLHPEKTRAYMQIYSDRVTPQETFPPPSHPQQQPPVTAVQPAPPTLPLPSAVTTTTASTTAAAMRLLSQPTPTSINAVLGQALTTAAAVLGQPVPLPITASSTATLAPASFGAISQAMAMPKPAGVGVASVGGHQVRWEGDEDFLKIQILKI